MRFRNFISANLFQWLTGLLLSIVLATGALANGPVYLDESSPQRKIVALDNLGGWSEFFVRGSRTRTGDFSLDETILAPGIHLDTAGGLYERQLLTFRAGGTLSYQHRSLDGTVENSDDLSFQDFAGNLDLLPEKPLKLHLFGNRTHGWHSSPYKSSTRTRSTAWGIGADLGLAELPSTLTWSREEYLEEYYSGDRITTRDRLRFGVKRSNGPIRGSLTMRHEAFRKNLQPQNYSTDGADGRISYRPGKTLGLAGSMHWLHRYGSREHTNFSTRATTRWNPRPDFGGQVEAEHRRLRPGGKDVPVVAANSGALSVRHLLYGSLETTMGMNLQDETSRLDDLEVGTLRRTSGHLRLDYRRRLAVGALQLSTSRTLLRQDRTGTETERPVSNEGHVLPDLAEVRLENPDVVPGSVVVTDATGYVVYTENLDFALTEVGGFTLLNRIPTGAIAEDERIQVDYRYLLSPDLVFDAATWSLAARFDGNRVWSVWTRHQDTDETPVSGSSETGLQDRTRNVAGGLLRRGRVTLRQEYETHRLAETRFKTNRLQLDTRFRPGRRWRASVGANHTWSRTVAPRRTQRYLQLNARTAYAGAGGSTASLESWFRWNEREDGIAAPGDGLYGGRLRYTRRWRALTLEAEVTLQSTDRNEIDDDRLVFRTGLRRVF
ncbi:MAG: hypothetical protein KOO60_08635 [Gemmatimonadales bacterium]|nr:hypothetical protein [Gemmatimonadales bacterium]